MIKCINCNSYAVEFTGIVYTTYPEQVEYKCSDCGKVFTVQQSLDDLSSSENVTYRIDIEFFKSIIETGSIPKYLSYYTGDYSFYKCLNDDYFYKNTNNKFIHLHIDKALITEAEQLYENRTNFFKKVQKYTDSYRKAIL